MRRSVHAKNQTEIRPLRLKMRGEWAKCGKDAPPVAIAPLRRCIGLFFFGEAEKEAQQSRSEKEYSEYGTPLRTTNDHILSNRQSTKQQKGNIHPVRLARLLFIFFI